MNVHGSPGKADFDPNVMKKKSPSDLSRFWHVLSRNRRVQVILLCFLMLAGALAELVTLGAVLPFLTLMTQPERAYSFPIVQNIASSLGWSNPDDLQLPAALLFSLLATLAGIIRITLAWASNKLVFGIGFDLSVEVYRRQLYQPYTYHVSRNTSETLAAISKVQIVTQGALMPALQGLLAAVIATAILCGLIFIDPVVAGVAGLGFSFVYLLISLSVRNQLRKNSKLIARQQSTRIRAVQEGLGGIRDVLLDNAQPVYVKRLADEEAPLRAAQAANNLIGALPKYMLESLGMVLIAGLAYFISLRAGGLASALPVLGALALGGQKLIPLLQQVYQGWTKFSGNRRLLVDVLDLAQQPISTVLLNNSANKSLPFNQMLTLKDVDFSYHAGGPLVLKNINLEIPQGAKVGFIGATGSGKSTLIDLIMGLLSPSSGNVSVDGLILDDAGRLAWQQHIAHVPQTIFLSDASIAENIALGVEASAIDHKRLTRALEHAQLLEFVNTLPDGVQTKVGERGVRLSGGQRQRIGIARALYKRRTCLSWTRLLAL
jgi:ATP-binding cassette, subfamily B, bacterial PglK